jgi:GH18 family chitinase
MESRGWLITASVSPSRFRLNEGYDVPRIAPYLHFILLKSYDFHSERDPAANHPAPLRNSFDEDPLSVYFNVVSIRLVISLYISSQFWSLRTEGINLSTIVF